MKVLILGNSNDTSDWTGGGKKRHELLRDLLAAEFGEPVDVVARSIWPDDRMVEMIGRWMSDFRPDIVYLNVISFWFQYESVPLRVQRLLGWLGPVVARAGFRMAESKRWSHNAVFRSARRALQATIGGDTHFTTGEVIERCSGAIRLVLREEGVTLVVKGPLGRVRHGVTGRQLRRNERRRLEVDQALGQLCKQLHVDYERADVPDWTDLSVRVATAGDGLHANADGHVLYTDAMYPIVRRACLRRLGVEPTGVVVKP